MVAGRTTVPRARDVVPAVVVIAALAIGAVLTGCGGPEFPDKAAVVTLGGDRRSFVVDSCGLDRRTLFVVGRADDGAVVQAVVGLEADRETGVPASTGITVDLDPQREDTRVAAFGAEAWERRGATARRRRSAAPTATVHAA